jgi:adenylate cyclase class IV
MFEVEKKYIVKDLDSLLLYLEEAGFIYKNIEDTKTYYLSCVDTRVRRLVHINENGNEKFLLGSKWLEEYVDERGESRQERKEIEKEIDKELAKFIIEWYPKDILSLEKRRKRYIKNSKNNSILDHVKVEIDTVPVLEKAFVEIEVMVKDSKKIVDAYKAIEVTRAMLCLGIEEPRSYYQILLDMSKEQSMNSS